MSCTLKKGIWTKYLPDQVLYDAIDGEDMTPGHELELALANLGQQGLITSHQTWGGTQIMGCVSQTVLGKAFIDACKLRNERS